MKKTKFILVLALTAIVKLSCAQVYQDSKSKISFYSKTAIEDIDATNSEAMALLNSTNNEIAFQAIQTKFVFKSSFMQEHYNENYMESEKFPFATFKGKINETIDYTKNETYKVTVTGKLTIHGVEQDRTIPGTLTIKDGKITLDAKFDVKVADHKIKVPSLYAAKIAEVVQVTVNSVLEPRKKATK